eukprot:7675112-Pyramimonas_sp.AAC.1
MAGFASGSGMGDVNIRYTGAGAHAVGSSPGGVPPLQPPATPPMSSQVEVPAALPAQSTVSPPSLQ